MVIPSHCRGKGRQKSLLKVTHHRMLDLGLNCNSHSKAQNFFNILRACLWVCFRILECNIYSDDVSIFKHIPKIHVQFLHAMKDYSVQNPFPPSETQGIWCQWSKVEWLQVPSLLNNFMKFTSNRKEIFFFVSIYFWFSSASCSSLNSK